MFSKIQEYLKKIDIFGQQITLSFKQEEEYRTVFGGTLSFCIIVTILSFFYSNIVDFFQKNQLSSQQELQFENDPDNIILSPDGFMFAVQIDQDNFTTNPYFNITLEQRQYIRDENGTQIKSPVTFVDLVPCTIDHFQAIFGKNNSAFDRQFKQYNLFNFLCPNLTHPSSQNMSVSGAWTSQKFQFLKFSISACESNAENSFSWKPNCQTEEQMKEKLSKIGSFRFQVYTTNYLINANSAHNYIEPFISIEQFYSFVPNTMYVQSDIFIRSTTATNEEGILMYPGQSQKVYTTRDYRDNREQISITSLSPGHYGAFYFVRSPFSYYIKRSFTTIDQLLSYIGGFSQFIIVVVGVFIKYYNRQHMIIEMANDLYEFDLNKMKQSTNENLKKLLSNTKHGREALKRQQNKNNGESAIQIQSMSVFKSKPEMGQFLSPQSTQLKESIKININSHRQSKLKRLSAFKIQCSSYFDQFKKMIISKQHLGINARLLISQLLPLKCIQSDECLVLEKAITQINKELDIQHIIKYVHETIKLKRVLFNKDQITLFNFAHKPTISLIRENGNRKSTVIRCIQDHCNNEILLSQLFTDLIDAYQKLIGIDDVTMSEEQRRFNQRLISLLGGRLPQVLEKELAKASDESMYDQKEENLQEI